MQILYRYFKGSFIYLLFLFCCFNPVCAQNQNIIGEWKAIGVYFMYPWLCDNFNDSSDFRLKLYSNGKYEIVFNNPSVRTNSGLFEYHSEQQILTLTRVYFYCCDESDTAGNGRYDVYKSSFPVRMLKNDTLKLRYNYCCNKDTCDQTSGDVFFIRYSGFPVTSNDSIEHFAVETCDCNILANNPYLINKYGFLDVSKDALLESKKTGNAKMKVGFYRLFNEQQKISHCGYFKKKRLLIGFEYIYDQKGYLIKIRKILFGQYKGDCYNM